ncbi:hypothetical protein L7F22_009145 [Adiantum nelumboides]|nr:hypothetical protein [Adiantum nelumboides]
MELDNRVGLGVAEWEARAGSIGVEGEAGQVQEEAKAIWGQRKSVGEWCEAESTTREGVQLTRAAKLGCRTGGWVADWSSLSVCACHRAAGIRACSLSAREEGEQMRVLSPPEKCMESSSYLSQWGSRGSRGTGVASRNGSPLW